MIDTFIEGLEDQNLKIYDHDTILECFSLEDNGGKIQAQEGEHDDRVIANCIAVKVAIDQFKKLQTFSNITDMIRI